MSTSNLDLDQSLTEAPALSSAELAIQRENYRQMRKLLKMRSKNELIAIVINHMNGFEEMKQLNKYLYEVTKELKKQLSEQSPSQQTNKDVQP